MNFVALIGIVESMNIDKNDTICMVKVEKPELEANSDNWYDIISVKLNSEMFKTELESAKTGDIVGIKGRIVNSNVVAERLQVF
ncbi:MAG: hypothetical protein LBV53_00220 [Mycoplasmataceae bacterium]|nr:hypothetical protein [Mycoplasmataceae bacterium]